MDRFLALVAREPVRFGQVVTAAFSLAAALLPNLSAEARAGLVALGFAVAEWVRSAVVPVAKLPPTPKRPRRLPGRRQES